MNDIQLGAPGTVPPSHFPINPNGHLLDEWVLSRGVDPVTVESAQRNAFGDPRSLGYFLDIGRCFYCGDTEFLAAEVTPDSSVRLLDPCPHLRGIEISFEVDFPFGRVVVSDDLRDTFPEDAAEDRPSLNFAPGQRAWSLRRARAGVAAGCASDRGLDVYRMPDYTYVIATAGWSEEDDEIAPEGGIKLADICTDLWAYSLADYADYLSKGGQPEQDMEWSRSVIDVEPGRYRFTHHACERGFDRDADGPVVYADFARIGPATTTGGSQ